MYNGDSFVSSSIDIKAPPNDVLAGQTDPDPEPDVVDDNLENQ